MRGRVPADRRNGPEKACPFGRARPPRSSRPSDPEDARHRLRHALVARPPGIRTGIPASILSSALRRSPAPRTGIGFVCIKGHSRTMDDRYIQYLVHHKGSSGSFVIRTRPGPFRPRTIQELPGPAARAVRSRARARTGSGAQPGVARGGTPPVTSGAGRLHSRFEGGQIAPHSKHEAARARRIRRMPTLRAPGGALYQDRALQRCASAAPFSRSRAPAARLSGGRGCCEPDRWNPAV